MSAPTVVIETLEGAPGWKERYVARAYAGKAWRSREGEQA